MRSEGAPAIHLGTIDFRNCISKQYSQLKLHIVYNYTSQIHCLCKAPVERALELQNILISIIIAKKLINFVFLLSTGIIKVEKAIADYS